MMRDALNLSRAFFFKNPVAPIQFIHFITSRCNATCEHCFYWEELNQPDQLTLDEIKKISQSMGPIYQLMLTGGEPFLREDIADIAETYYKNNKVRSLNIPTNGLLKDRIASQCEEILQRCPGINFSLNLSLDGLKKHHDQTRGVNGCFDKAVAMFKEVSKLKEKYPRFNTTVISTLTEANQDEIKQLHQFIKKELNCNVMQVNFLRGNPKDASLNHASLDVYKEINELNFDSFVPRKDLPLFNFIRLKAWLRVRLNKVRYNIILDTVKYNQYVTPCYAGYLNAVMYENGDIFVCELLDKKIGNVRDVDFNFNRLWHSREIKEVRKFIRETNCFCTHECFLTTSVLFNPKQLTKVLLARKKPEAPLPSLSGGMPILPNQSPENIK